MQKSKEEIKHILDFLLFLNGQKNVICRYDYCDEDYLWDRSLPYTVAGYLGIDVLSEEFKPLAKALIDELNHHGKHKEEMLALKGDLPCL